MAKALAGSTRSGAGRPVSISDTHRDVGIYELVKTRSSGYQTKIYLSVNRHQKSDKDAAEWLLDLNQFRYVDRSVQIRLEYRLTSTPPKPKR